jgi:hypothetical protein
VPVGTGGYAVRAFGMSELVRNQERSFLTALDEIQEMRPEDTALVADPSPQYRRSRLYLESLLRRTPPTKLTLNVCLMATAYGVRSLGPANPSHFERLKRYAKLARKMGIVSVFR